MAARDATADDRASDARRARRLVAGRDGEALNVPAPFPPRVDRAAQPQPIGVPAARAEPTLRRYDLRRVRVPIGTGSLSLVVPDAGDWRRRGEWTDAAVRGGEPPYWTRIWPAAVAAARVVWRLGDLSGRRVLDLGCGLGLPGLAAAGAGAAVTFADRQPDALAFARWNGVRTADPARIGVVELDWASGVVPGTFDVVVLADVSYRAQHHGALQRQLATCLARDGVVLHADPLRAEATPFVHWLQRGFACHEVAREVAFGGARTAVRVVAAASGGVPAAWRTALGPAGAAR